MTACFGRIIGVRLLTNANVDARAQRAFSRVKIWLIALSAAFSIIMIMMALLAPAATSHL